MLERCVLCVPVQYQEGQKRRKPNYSSVDLSEVEWEDKDDVVCVRRISNTEILQFICLIRANNKNKSELSLLIHRLLNP